MAFGLATTIALSGCATTSGNGETSQPATGPPTTGIDPSPGTLEVATTYRLSHKGIAYIEGAMADVILRKVGTGTVKVRTKSAGESIWFRNLEPGTYILKPALRPCDGTCGYLDPRLDGCRSIVEIDGDLQVRVDFTVGEACRVNAV